MRVLVFILSACLGGCAAPAVRCDGRLTRINAAALPANDAAPQRHAASPQKGSHIP